ncbi:MAG: leucine-rich repeat domain-containing protein [Clostridia bacterium]|nr:leucine-rich repeat domain-containing protein [Clostridia bacterium]
MEEKELFKNIKKESEERVPDVYGKILLEAEAQGLLNGDNAEAYTDGETVTLGRVSPKAFVITGLAGLATACLAIALPLALIKDDGGIPPVGKPFGEGYSVGAVATAKLAESFFGGDEGAEANAQARFAKTASLVVNPDEVGIERYISEFDNYFYACNSFFGEKPANVEYVENHDVKYDNSIIISGYFSNGDVARYAMYYSEARVLDDNTVTGDEVKYYLEGYLCLNEKGYSIVGERVYADSTKENEKSLSLKAYPFNFNSGCVEMSIAYGDDGSVKEYSFTVIRDGEIVSESVLTFPQDNAYVIEFKGDDGERDGKFTVNRPKTGWESLKIGYEIGEFTSEFHVKATASKLERVVAPDGLVYTDLGDGTYSITGYDKNKSLPAELILPSDFDGKKIVAIGTYAFRSCTDIERLVIPDGVTVIGMNAFESCEHLTDVIFPEGLEEINGSFFNCRRLTGVVLPDSLLKLGPGSFSNSALTTLNIPANVNSIGNFVVSGCNNLLSMTVDPANTKYHSQDDCIIDTESKTLIAGCKTSKIPADGSVEVIGDYAFDGITTVDELVIPATVQKIGERAFMYSNAVLNIEEGLRVIESEAFYGYYCSEVNLPESLEVLGDKVFYTAFHLKTLNIPVNVKQIGRAITENCNTLTTLTVAEENPVYHSGGNCVIETSTKTLIAGCKNSVIPDDGSVEIIGRSAFKFSFITNINIPDTVKEIGDYAFADSFISNIRIPDSVQKLGQNAFSKCPVLTYVEVSENVSEIPVGCFYECYMLNNIIFRNNNLTSIVDFAFYNCYSLQFCSVPSSVTYIGNSAFEGCSRLEQISIPNSLQEITSGMLKGCENITSISISSKISAIGAQAFYGCLNLQTISYTAGTVNEWLAIPKGDGWDFGIMSYRVECRDGTILENGNVVRN